MAKFQAGSKVIMADTKKKGIITSVSDYIRGRQFYIVNWGDYESEEIEAELIEDCDITNMFERCKRGLFSSYSDFSQINTSSKIKSSNNSTISSLMASKTLFRGYQFKPLLKFINSPNRRLLIADEVGLGKTIEAGHIMLELKARRELHNTLIICPKSLEEKWRGELIEKFGLAFKIYDSANDFIKDMEDNDGRVRAILNYEKIRYDSAKKDPAKSKRKYQNIVDYLSTSDKKIGLVLCDEAHKMRNKGTKTYDGAEIIMNLAESVVFLTATPIMLGPDNLFHLLHLLDSQRYFNEYIFDARRQENAPFVKAISLLNNRVSLTKISDYLENEVIDTTLTNTDRVVIYSRQRTVEEVFGKDPVYQEIKEMLRGEDTDKVRAKLQYLLNSMSMMNNIFSRTRKRDVSTDMSKAERKPKPIKIVLTPEEQVIFDKVIQEYIDDNSYTDYWGEERMTQGGALGLVQKKRQVASSVYAYMNKEEDLDKGIDAYEGLDDAKVDKLVEIIEEVFKHGTKKIVVFALFRKTLKYLGLRLKKKGYNSLIIHGGVENRAEVLDDFKNNPQNHILLSSEVGSEGLDMQFCNSMVNYDLPWNPMVVEQRIGRIDRFGQKSPVVNIYNMIVAGSIQEQIYMRLLERIGIFRGTIGDLEAILDSPISEGQTKTIQDVFNKTMNELYTCNLTPEEIEQRLDEIRRAIEKERLTLEQIEEGLTNTLTNDAYFKDEIDRILRNKSYVTPEELRNYLQSIIDKHLTTCNLIDCGNNTYEFKLPMSEKQVLSGFLTAYQADGEENAIAFRKFKREIEEKPSILITFDQKKAYDDISLIFMNIYHPVIQASLKYFSKNQDSANNSFCFAVKRDDVLKAGKCYYLGVYQFVTTRMVQGVQKKSETLQPYVFDITTCKLEGDENVVERLYGSSQVDGLEYNPSEDVYSSEIVNLLKEQIYDATKAERKSRYDELCRQAESDRIHSEEQTIEYYNIAISRLTEQIKNREDVLDLLDVNSKEYQNIEKLVKMNRGLLESQKKELYEKLEIINRDAEISVECKPVSLSLIKIL